MKNCAALEGRTCYQNAIKDSEYCFCHDKVARGIMEPANRQYYTKQLLDIAAKPTHKRKMKEVLGE